MKSRIIPFVAVTVFLAGSSPSSAAERPLHGLPEWMLGQWVVTQVYEDPYVPRPDPEGDPVLWLSDQIMTVEPNRIELGNMECVKFSIHETTDMLSRFVSSYTASSIENLEIEDSDGVITYIKVHCGDILVKKRDTPDDKFSFGKIDWRIITSDKDRLRMAFYGGSFLKLRRLAPTS